MSLPAQSTKIVVGTRNIVKRKTCEFKTTSDHWMEVHNEKEHSNSLTCEICDFKAQKKSVLEIHLVTCELYKCSKCEFKSRRLSQVKTHVRKKHESSDHSLHHLKMDRDDPTKVSDTVHFFEDI